MPALVPMTSMIGSESMAYFPMEASFSWTQDGANITSKLNIANKVSLCYSILNSNYRLSSNAQDIYYGKQYDANNVLTLEFPGIVLLSYYIWFIKLNEFINKGIGLDAAKKLLSLKTTHDIHIVGVGIDSGSIDNGSNDNYEVHRMLYKENIYAIENMNNLNVYNIVKYS